MRSVANWTQADAPQRVRLSDQSRTEFGKRSMDEPAAPAIAPVSENPTSEQPAASAEAASLIGVLDADQRIRADVEQSERTLWTSAIAVTLLYAGVIAAQVMDLGGFSAIELERLRQLRRGQDATTISVELVPDPDKDAKTKKWREGAQQPPTPAPPQPQQQAMLPQPEVEQPKQPPEEQAKDEPKEEPAEKQEKEDGRPSLPSLRPSSTRRPTISKRRSKSITTASRDARNRSSRPCIPAAACRCAARAPAANPTNSPRASSPR